LRLTVHSYTDLNYLNPIQQAHDFVSATWKTEEIEVKQPIFKG